MLFIRMATLPAIFAILLLNGCSDDSSDSGPSVSGRLNIAIANLVDSDVNDIRASYTSNNDPANPQVLQSSLLTLQGYVTRTPTGGDAEQERFANQADEADYFRAELQQGQRVVIQVSGSNITSRISAALIELDDNGNMAEDGIHSCDATPSRVGFEFIANKTAPYLIAVRGFNSSSRYVLQLQPAQAQASDIQTQSCDDFVSGEMLVQNKPQTDLNNTLSALQLSLTGNSHDDYPQLVKVNNLNAFSATTTSQVTDPLQQWSNELYQKINTLEKIALLNQQDNVEYAQPNFIYRSQLTPNDNRFDLQWPLHQINAPLAWDISTGAKTGGGDVVIAVLDSGVLTQQPDLLGQLIGGYDFVADTSVSGDGNGIDSNPEDPGNPFSTGNYPYHGTHVAGIAAAASNNSLGVAGVSWQAKIMPVRVLGNTGTGTSHWMIQGLRYAAQLSNDSGTVATQAADVINLSLGSTYDATNAPAEQALFDQLYQQNILVVAAAGNSATSALFYPASYNHVISVSATDFAQNLADYSNTGSQIDVAAPGGSVNRDDNLDGEPDVVWSLGATMNQGSLEYLLSGKQGTSMAAPHVAGVLALMKAVYPQLTANQVENLLSNGLLTNDIGQSGRDNLFGYGLIDTLKAVKEAQKLANGGELPPQPTQLITDPQSLLIGSQNSLAFTIKNLGGNSPTISVSEQADWLTLEAVGDTSIALTTDAEIRYRAVVDRASLQPGFYRTTIRISADGDDPAALDLEVYIQVGSFSSVGELTQQYVLLVKSGETAASRTVAAASDGSFNISNVDAGSYQLVAGSDIDVDNRLCDTAETCGIYPLPGQSLIEVNDNDISGLSLTVSIYTENGVQSAQQVSYEKSLPEGNSDENNDLNKTIAQ